MTIAVVWRYEVRVESIEAFESAYGPSGRWAALFAGGPGYQGTELIRSGQPGVYVTIDRWNSAEQYRDFLAAHADEYTEIDAQYESLTEREEKIVQGEFWH